MRVRSPTLVAEDPVEIADAHAQAELPKLVGESDAIIGVFKKLAQIVENIYLDGLGEMGQPARLPSVFKIKFERWIR